MSGGFRLGELPAAARTGISLLLLVNLGGFVASGAHLRAHHGGRDGRPGLSMDDLAGAYHGVEVRAPLAQALERGHPLGLAAAEREALLAWVGGERVNERYDDLDLGDAAPAEILARSCVSCHAADSQDVRAREVPLRFWDEVERVAYGREIAPVPSDILLASTHTHAIALATITLVLAGLVQVTRWPVRLRSGLVLLAGAALAADLAGWWLARSSPAMVTVVVVAGTAYAASVAAMTGLVLAELWWPARR